MKKRIMKLVIIIFSLSFFFGVVILYATFNSGESYKYPSEYSSLPINLKIVDKESGDPIGDVIVIAYWLLEGGLYGDEYELLAIQEIKSNSEGEVYIEGWGPIKIPKDAPSNLRLKSRSPGLIFFNEKYFPDHLYDFYAMKEDPDPISKSDWSGKTVGLIRFEGDEEQYSKNMIWLEGLLSRVFVSERSTCYLDSIPTLISYMNENRWRVKKEYSFDSKIYYHDFNINRFGCQAKETTE